MFVYEGSLQYLAADGCLSTNIGSYLTVMKRTVIVERDSVVVLNGL